MLVDKIHKTLDGYQGDLNELNDGEKMLNSLSTSIRILIEESIKNANNTDSIDDRIKELVKGLQSVLNEVNLKQETYLVDKKILEIKISVLDDLLLQDLENQTNPDSEQ